MIKKKVSPQSETLLSKSYLRSTALSKTAVTILQHYDATVLSSLLGIRYAQSTLTELKYVNINVKL